jgi:hypothetical protein
VGGAGVIQRFVVIKPLDAFLAHLSATDRSPDTVCVYMPFDLV